MSMTPRSALAVPAIVALTCFAATSPAAADTGPVVRSSGDLADLQPGTAGPFDSADASVQIVSSGDGASHTVLRVRGVSGADGTTFGAHLHVGPCVAGNGAAALGHYHAQAMAGDPTPEISEDTEVWLDLTIDDGAGTSTASVPFQPLSGERSVVIHALGTDPHTGFAGARLACLPVVW